MTCPQFDNFLSTFGNHEQRLRDFMRKYWQNTVYEDLTQNNFSDEKIQGILDGTGQRLQQPRYSNPVKKLKNTFDSYFN
jgi:hypothetical protein